MPWVEAIYRHATVYTNDLTSDVRRRWEAKESNQGCHLDRLSKPPQRCSTIYLFQILFVAQHLHRHHFHILDHLLDSYITRK